MLVSTAAALTTSRGSAERVRADTEQPSARSLMAQAFEQVRRLSNTLRFSPGRRWNSVPQASQVLLGGGGSLGAAARPRACITDTIDRLAQASEQVRRLGSSCGGMGPLQFVQVRTGRRATNRADWMRASCLAYCAACSGQHALRPCHFAMLSFGRRRMGSLQMTQDGAVIVSAIFGTVALALLRLAVTATRQASEQVLRLRQ